MISFENLLEDLMQDKEFKMEYDRIKNNISKLERMLSKTDNPNRKQRIMRKIKG